DVSMPYLSGFQVLDKIKKYFGERYTPIIFLTVSIKIDDKLRAFHGGAVDYLTKPVSPEELLARIKNFIEIKDRHDGLKQAATYDWMTGVLNKAHFIEKAKEELEKALRNKTPLSFIFMDIDHFKKINDEIGHLAGDTVISEFANRLKHAIRKIDLIGRFGGDEFMLMLPHKGKKEALTVAARLGKNIKKKTVIFEKNKMHVTASMGIVSVKTDKKININALIRLADEALYEAKAKGGNRHILKTLL
ncbi:MAG: diguanylate cyclase, partial [Candidatus Omnitrophica bacterium]|nr:diguanylate cyclase [Candidatus Omnitrophota bacterium]